MELEEDGDWRDEEGIFFSDNTEGGSNENGSSILGIEITESDSLTGLDYSENTFDKLKENADLAFGDILDKLGIPKEYKIITGTRMT